MFYSSFLPEKYLTFLKAVIGLQSFPVAVFYMVLIPTSLLWRKFTSPLGLQKVRLRILCLIYTIQRQSHVSL